LSTWIQRLANNLNLVLFLRADKNCLCFKIDNIYNKPILKIAWKQIIVRFWIHRNSTGSISATSVKNYVRAGKAKLNSNYHWPYATQKLEIKLDLAMVLDILHLGQVHTSFS
jgi:hypothetical protein